MAGSGCYGGKDTLEKEGTAHQLSGGVAVCSAGIAYGKVLKKVKVRQKRVEGRRKVEGQVAEGCCFAFLANTWNSAFFPQAVADYY